MTFDDFLKSLSDVLSPEMTGARGEVNLCADRMHAYQVLLDSPANSYRIALNLEKSQPAPGKTVQAGNAELVTVMVHVLRPMGLTAKAQQGLHSTTAGGGLSLLHRADKVRRLLAGARWFLEPGIWHPEVDPTGLRWGGQRIIHLERGDDGADAFIGVVEQTWEIWITLDPPAAEEVQEVYIGSPWDVPNQRQDRTLTASLYTNRTDGLSFAQTTAGITLTLEAPTDGSRKAMTFSNTGSATLKLWPAGMTDGVAIAPGTSGLYHWDAATLSWQPGL